MAQNIVDPDRTVRKPAFAMILDRIGRLHSRLLREDTPAAALGGKTLCEVDEVATGYLSRNRDAPTFLRTRK